MKKNRTKSVVKGPVDMLTREEFEEQERNVRIALIQRLIPLGLMAAAEELQREVASLASSTQGVVRYGTNPGTVRLGNQKVPIQVPRVRGPDGEIPLESYSPHSAPLRNVVCLFVTSAPLAHPCHRSGVPPVEKIPESFRAVT